MKVETSSGYFFESFFIETVSAGKPRLRSLQMWSKGNTQNEMDRSDRVFHRKFEKFIDFSVQRVFHQKLYRLLRSDEYFHRKLQLFISFHRKVENFIDLFLIVDEGYFSYSLHKLSKTFWSFLEIKLTKAGENEFNF